VQDVLDRLTIGYMADQGDVRTAPAKGSLGDVTRRRTLLVLRAGDMTVHPLPLVGEVAIGRGADADIKIDEPSLSRVHLTLVLEDRAIAVIDRGSANGSSLRGVRLPVGAKVHLHANEVIGAGDVALVIQDLGGVTTSTSEIDRTRPSGAMTTGVAPVVVDPAMQQLYDLARRVGQGTISVLIVGETGAGKEILAEVVHASSPRARGPLVRVNCAALTESLVESELFGHVKGAFTGANADRVGYIEAAHGGTLLLDEIGELPAAAQAKLLRVVEDRRVVPIGSPTPRPVDVRFVAATNRDLEAEATAGRFRQDLFFRLAGVVLAVPPLRQRPAEIEALALAFAATAARRIGRPQPKLTGDALAALRAHAWTGNVRELRNVIERSVLLADKGVIDRSALQLDTPAAAAPAGTALSDELATIERQRIVAALERCNGNQTRAADLLGMPRRTFVKRLETYGIARPRKK
jgi:DNA-binding NtrC family response regulator